MTRTSAINPLGAAVLMAAAAASAATYQWDTNGSTAGLGGTGTWNGTNTNWDLVGTAPDDGTAATSAVPAISTADSFTFGGTAGTVTVGTNVSVGAITFAADGYTIQTGSNTLTLNSAAGLVGTNSGTITGLIALAANQGTGWSIASGKTVTIDAVISGGFNFRRTAGGTLNLNAANTYTGTTALIGGFTNVAVLANGGTASSIGSSSNAAANLVLNGGKLQYVGTSAASTDRLFSLGGNSSLANNASNALHTLTFSGTGSLGYTVNNAMTLTLEGSNTGSNVLATRLVNPSTGALSLAKAGGGRWQVTNSLSSFTGGVSVNAGTLAFSSVGALGSGTAIAISGGASSGTLEATEALTLAAGRTITVGNTGNPTVSGNLRNGSSVATTFEVAAQIVNAAGASNRVNLSSPTTTASVIRLSNDANSFVGTLSTGFGVFEFTSVANSGVASALGAGSTVAVNNSASLATLRHVGSSLSSTNRAIDWTATTGGLTLDSSGTGAVQWLATGSLKSGAGSATLRLTGSNTGDNTLAQAINDQGGTTALTKEGAGLWILSGANAFSGAVTVSNGTLRLAANGALGTGAVTVAGGRLDFAGRTVTNSSVSLTGGGVANVVDAAALTSLGSAPKISGTVGGQLDVGSLPVDVTGGLTVTGALSGAGATFSGGAVTLASGSFHRPGASPGLQTFEAGLTYAAGSTLDWEFAGDALSIRGSDYDGVNVTGGSFELDAAAVVRIVNLSAVDYSSANWNVTRSFSVVDSTGASFLGGAAPTLDTSLAGAFAAEGAWSLTTLGDGLWANWTPVPEPSTYGLILGGLALAGTALRRRRDRVKG